MRDLVPEGEYGRFFGRRAAATTALATALALLSGLLIDSLEASCAGTFCIRLFLSVYRQCGDRPFRGLATVDYARSTDATERSAHAHIDFAKDTIQRHQFPAVDRLFVFLEFCRQSRFSVLCSLYAEDAWLFDDGRCVGLYSLHRLSFVQETGGPTDPLLVRHLLLEARRSIHSLSSAAGLLRVVRAPA